MMPNLDPKQMQRMMQQMGIKSEELKANRVVIEKDDGKVVIESPQIMVIDMKGVKSFQISGEVKEESGPSEEDVKLVMEQTGAGKEEAEEALKETNDIAEAILKLKKD